MWAARASSRLAQRHGFGALCRGAARHGPAGCVPQPFAGVGARGGWRSRLGLLGHRGAGVAGQMPIRLGSARSRVASVNHVGHPPVSAALVVAEARGSTQRAETPLGQGKAASQERHGLVAGWIRLYNAGMRPALGSSAAEPPSLAGMDRVIVAYLSGVDRTLLLENLKKTPEERVVALMALQRLAREAHRAGELLRGR